MKYNETLYEYEAGYSRIGTIKVVYKNEHWEAECNVCSVGSNTVPILYTDPSEGEYGGCLLCKKCIDKIFDGVST